MNIGIELKRNDAGYVMLYVYDKQRMGEKTQGRLSTYSYGSKMKEKQHKEYVNFLKSLESTVNEFLQDN